MLRKNKILEFKLKQLASQTNKVMKTTTNKEILNNKNVEVKNDSYYDILLQDDKDELKDLSDELENFIAMMFQNESLNIEYIQKLSNIYKKYAALLNSYNEFYEIASTLNIFSNLIITLDSKFLEDVGQTGIFFESLQLTFESFRKSTWEKEANDPKFYNASLNNDIQLIIDYLEGNEAQENEIEFF